MTSVSFGLSYPHCKILSTYRSYIFTFSTDYPVKATSVPESLPLPPNTTSARHGWNQVRIVKSRVTKAKAGWCKPVFPEQAVKNGSWQIDKYVCSRREEEAQKAGAGKRGVLVGSLVCALLSASPHCYQIPPVIAIRSTELFTCIVHLSEAIRPSQKYQLMKTYSWWLILCCCAKFLKQNYVSCDEKKTWFCTSALIRGN